MTGSTTTVSALNETQNARVAALSAAKIILTGTGGLFGGTENNRSTYDLIEIAEYVLDGVPADDDAPEPEPAPRSFLEYLMSLPPHGEGCGCPPDEEAIKEGDDSPNESVADADSPVTGSQGDVAAESTDA